MGVDAKWGRFPICPEMSRFVPVCPLLSRFVLVPGPKKDKRGQTGTKWDISGQMGETPPFSIYPHLSGKKKQHKHKLFGPDFPRTFPTLMPGCPGVKKFLPTSGAAGKRTFWCGRPRFSVRTSMTRRVVEKLCTKKVCVDILAPHLALLWKSKFLYRYRPEGIVRIFFGLILDPPGTYAFTAKKGKFICTGQFFPHGMAFLGKRGGDWWSQTRALLGQQTSTLKRT